MKNNARTGSGKGWQMFNKDLIKFPVFIIFGDTMLKIFAFGKHFIT